LLLKNTSQFIFSSFCFSQISRFQIRETEAYVPVHTTSPTKFAERPLEIGASSGAAATPTAIEIARTRRKKLPQVGGARAIRVALELAGSRVTKTVSFFLLNSIHLFVDSKKEAHKFGYFCT
jgi:hypothetical protein